MNKIPSVGETGLFTMKKKRGGQCDATKAVSASESYVVGQVSGSLFQSKSTNSTDTLASLFNTQHSLVNPVFVTAPKPSPKKRELSEDGIDKVTDTTYQPPAKKQKPAKEKQLTDAEKKVQDRECALKNADDEDGVTKNAKPKKKAKSTQQPGDKRPNDEEEPPRKKRPINKAEERIKNKRTVFVGNLPVNCTKKMLKAMFKEHGTIESLRFRSVTREDATVPRKAAAIQRKVHPKRHSINAYVVFKAESDAESALKRNGTEIESGYHIRVDRACKSAAHDHKRSIFVGNLTYDMKEEELWGHFQDCGELEGVRLVRDRDTGMGKGFGYVLFESTDAVQLALKLDNSVLMGRKIRVKRSVKKEKEKPKPAQKMKGPAKTLQKGAGPPNTGKGNAVNSFRGKPGKPFRGNFSNSFKGEMAKPGDGGMKKNKGLKKRFKQKNAKKFVNI